MIYILAGNGTQAQECAAVRGLGTDEWRQVTSAESLKSAKAGSTLYTFGTYRSQYMFEWREMEATARARGMKVEQVIDGRLTR